jgi:DNA-directed RNA polymerase specialized sigma24 family protein
VSPGPAPGPGDPGLELTQAYIDHAPYVYRQALRAAIGDRQGAEDATQQAFMEAFREWHVFRRLLPAQQRARLCALAKWRVIDGWRATSCEFTTDALPDLPNPSGGEDEVIAAVTADRFWRQITTAVPVRAARVAYLRWHEQWNMTKIAGYLGVDRATVRRDLENVQAVARQLTEEVGFPAGSEGKEA